MPMTPRSLLLLALLASLSAHAQTINLKGTISDGSGKPVSGAVVTVLKLGLKDTTGSDGAYSFSRTVSILSPLPSAAGSITLTGSVLEFEVAGPASVSIEAFDVHGHLLKRERRDADGAGIHRWDIAGGYPADQLLILRVTVAGKVSIFRHFPLAGGRAAADAARSASRQGGALRKAAAAIDSLEVKAPGFGTGVAPLESYDQTVNVSLAAADRWGGLRNSPVKSGGCGKPQGATGGKKTIRSSNQNRSYILDVPANYNPDTPHLLFYISHWINGTSEQMRDNNYYSLKPLANAAGKPAIFVAPQSDGGTWQQKDHALFDDLVAYLEDNL